MIAWTTPTQQILIRGADLTACRVTVDIEQDCTRVSVVDPPMTHTEAGTLMEVTLTQEQAGALHMGTAKLQVNAIDRSGYRAATRKATISIGSNIRTEVMAYEQ